jgi:SPP1 gp7 family putative phage head morphogenesis protein
MDSANESLRDVFVKHAVDLEKLKVGERRKAIQLLKSLEDDLVALLAKHSGSNWSQARMRALLQQVRETISSAYADFQEKINKDLESIADLEANFAVDAVNSAIAGPSVDVVSVEFSPALLKAAVSNALVEGAPSQEWWSRQTAKTFQLFADTVRKGVISGTTTDDMVSTLRNGVFQNVLRRNVDAITRTSVAAVADEARSQVFEQNDDIISEVMQHSTLDSRTTKICMAYSGKRWRLPDYEPVDHDLPYNNGCPRHWNCRSVIVPVVPMFDVLGSRDGIRQDNARAERSFRQKLKEQGMDTETADRAVMGAQSSMDGYIPEDLDYEEWLRSKPEDFQIEVLGPGRWKLWNEGKLTFSELVDQSGDPLSLAELQKRVA